MRHVLEFEAIGFRIRHELQGLIALGLLQDQLRQICNGDFLVIADIHDFPLGRRRGSQQGEGNDRVSDIAE